MAGQLRKNRVRKAGIFIRFTGWFVMGGALALAFFWYFKPSVIRVPLWQAVCYVGGVIILLLISNVAKPFRTTFNPVPKAASYVPTVLGTCVRFAIITGLIYLGWKGEKEFTWPLHPTAIPVVGKLQFLWWLVSLVCLIIRAVISRRISEYETSDKIDAVVLPDYGTIPKPISNRNDQPFNFGDTSPHVSTDPDPEPTALPSTRSGDAKPRDFDPYLDEPHPSPPEPKQPEPKQPEKPKPHSPMYSHEHPGVPSFRVQSKHNPTGSQQSAEYGSGPAAAQTGSGPTHSSNTSGLSVCPRCNSLQPAYMHSCSACGHVPDGR